MGSVLVVSKNGGLFPVAKRLADEKGLIKIHTQQNFALNHKNLAKIESFGLLEQYDCILFDQNGHEEKADQCRASGLKVIGGGTFSRKLVHDNDYSTRVLTTLLKGVNCKKETDGIRLTVEGWFDGTELHYFTHTFNDERFMNGDKGMITESMGKTTWAVTRDSSKLIDRCLIPLTEHLNKVAYTGRMDVRVVLSESDVCFDGFEPYCNTTTLSALTEILKGTLFDFLWDIAGGSRGDIKTFDDYGVATCLSVPPYPYKAGQPEEKEYLNEVNEHALRHTMLMPQPLPTGEIGCVSARGATTREAMKRINRVLSKLINEADVQYRDDIGRSVEQKIEALKTWGWLSV